MLYVITKDVMAPTNGICDSQYVTPMSSQHPCEVGQGHEPHVTSGEAVKTE